MRPRLLPVLLAGVLLPTGLAGCGIPQETAVQVDGRLGQATESGVLSGSAVQPPGPAAAKDAKEFIRNYLSAAAGDREQAPNRVKQYIEPEARGWLEGKQSGDLYVVRLREEPEATPPDTDGTVTVTVKVQQLGVLRADGSLAPPGASETEYMFKLRSAGEGESGWRIFVEPPKLLLISDEALGFYYTSQTIYFWNSNQTRLVPDQRYLPKALPAERQLTEVVRWLGLGPQDWLAFGVLRPEQISLINNATGSDGRWEVNLRSGPDDKKLARLATQLAWSVPARVTGELDLKIQDQTRRVVDIDQVKSDHQSKYPLDGSPERFCIYDGAIHPLALTEEPPRSVPVDASRNRNLVTAALTRSDSKILAALVVTRADHRQQLKVGSGPSPVKAFHGDKQWFTRMSRPTWLRSLDPQHPYGLIAADGNLYRFDGSGNLSLVSLGGVSGKVTAVAASVEGHRVALVINGALYVAVVSTDGGAVNLGQPRRLVTKLTDITAVDWYAENRLVFAGSELPGGTREGRPAIDGATIDGVLETPHEPDMGVQVTNLSAYPGPWVAGVPSLSYMYEADNQASYRNNPIQTRIDKEQVQDVASPPAGTKAGNPTAPFFLY